MSTPQDAATLARERQPDPRLPILYFAFAHLCLAAALAVLAVSPGAVAGFFYHPRMLAVVHLVTLGWISSSILGALYMIAPMALRTSLPGGRLDTWAFAVFAVGTAGMASHFWIDEPAGMAWSAGMVLGGLLWVAGRATTAIARARLRPEIKLHFYFAFANLLLAAGLGLAIAVDKSVGFWPGYHLDRVYAHAHLAALGWALMLVMAAGYRLLPMLLPAAMPEGGWVWAGGLTLEVGVLGLAGTLLLSPRWALVPALICAGGIGIFLGRVAWMRRHPRPAPRELPRPDFGVWQVASALVCLALAAGLGLLILAAPPAAWELRAIMAYGVLGLMGFFGQMVSGVASRLVPLYAYMRALSRSGFRRSPPPPYDLPLGRVQPAIFALWTAGVPLLALGLAFDLLAAVRSAGGLLLVAVVLELGNQAAVLHGSVRRGQPLPAEIAAARGGPAGELR